MTDRVYFHVPGARSWHALEGDQTWPYRAACGRSTVSRPERAIEFADRIPAASHACAHCLRVIAARTDVEDTGDAGNTLP
jgi:hypothetical protein